MLKWELVVQEKEKETENAHMEFWCSKACIGRAYRKICSNKSPWCKSTGHCLYFESFLFWVLLEFVFWNWVMCLSFLEGYLLKFLCFLFMWRSGWCLQAIINWYDNNLFVLIWVSCIHSTPTPLLNGTMGAIWH